MHAHMHAHTHTCMLTSKSKARMFWSTPAAERTIQRLSRKNTAPLWESTSFGPLGDGNASSCDQLDAKTSDEGKSHRQIPFEGGLCAYSDKQKALDRRAQTMAHRSVKKKKRKKEKTNLKSSSSSHQGESGRLWKTKSTSRQWSSSLFTNWPRRSLHRACCNTAVQTCKASGPRGPTDTTRLTFVARPRKIDTAGITQDRWNRTMASGRAYPVVVMSLVATPRVEDKQSIAYFQARVVVIPEDLRFEGHRVQVIPA